MEEWTQYMNYYLKRNTELSKVRPTNGHIIRLFYIELENFDHLYGANPDTDRNKKNYGVNLTKVKLAADLNSSELLENNILCYN